MTRPIRNIFTIDVEDWFQVENYASVIERVRWAELELRVEANVDRLLALLAAKDVCATFFTLGWVAERVPELVRRVARAGHEVASHGWSHRPIWDLTREQFADDVRRSRELLCELSGQVVTGYRAPTFSITHETLWALESLAAAGYRYDSSIFPVHHDRYGIPDAPLAIHWRDEGLWELPLSVLQAGSLRLPVAGGGYLRLYPRALTARAVRQINAAGRPAVVYIHPWELDPEQPRVEGMGPLKSWRHHVGIRGLEGKLEWLLATFPFSPAGEVIAELTEEASSRSQWATAPDVEFDAEAGT